MLVAPPEQPRQATLASAQALYDRGLVVRAHGELIRASGPLAQLHDTDARLLAGRLCNQLGARRRAVATFYWTYRKNLTHAAACYYYLSSCVALKGPYRLLVECERSRARVPMERATLAHVLGLEASCLSIFRDHERALERLDEADALSPADPWLLTERASILARADRLDGALEQAERALSLRPGYGPALAQLASILSDRNEMERAVEMLSQGVQGSELGLLHWHLGSMLARLGRHADALVAFGKAAALLTLLEPAWKKTLFAERADSAYKLGDAAQAVAYAHQVDTEHYRGFAARLRERALESARREPEERKVLDVPWVRQKHMTCAPATLASIARFWSYPVDHDALAREICYGGTFHHGERTWAEQRGFVVREFSLTLDVTRSLIDRGVPIALTTVEPNSAHLQVLHGYDTLRGTVLVRDPSSRFDVEYEAVAFFRSYESVGPRGMVFVPAERAHLL
jgi:tetratricopeptide (TPR) repeat protein